MLPVGDETKEQLRNRRGYNVFVSEFGKTGIQNSRPKSATELPRVPKGTAKGQAPTLGWTHRRGFHYAPPSSRQNDEGPGFD